MKTTRMALAALSTLTLAGVAHATMTAPVPVYPAGITLFGTFPLQWMAVPGATWYRVWVSQSGSAPNILPCAFSHGLVDPGGCWVQEQTVTLQAPLAAGSYRWWVKAWSPQQDGRWSAGMPFLVATTRFEDLVATVFDYQTQLEWEKKTNDGSIHDVSKSYTWSATSIGPDGTLFTDFLAVLNLTACLGESADGVTVTGGGCPLLGFAYHNDWRLPGIDELKTIVDCSQGTSCLDPVFGPTSASGYWSSTSDTTLLSEFAWLLLFDHGSVSGDLKTNAHFARGVRGGVTVGAGCTTIVSGPAPVGFNWCLQNELIKMPVP